MIPTFPDDDADDDTEACYAVSPFQMKNNHD